MNYRITTLFLIALLSTLPRPGFAADSVPEQPATPSNETAAAAQTRDVSTLRQVTVVGHAEEMMTGSSTLDRGLIEVLSARNSSVSEVMGRLPGVQLQEQERSSLTAGEIQPAKISISGGKSYQNNVQIDGVSNNNMLDPEIDDPTSIMFVPSHPESLFLNSRLVEEVTLYRYNVPASFGSFTGGVVDIKTRRPEPFFYGELTYRTTSDRWTRFHVDPEIKEVFDNATEETFQPEFSRHDGGFLINVPISERLRLLTSYQINFSEIPLTHLLENKSQQRKNENFLLKLAYDLDGNTTMTGNLQYAPYRGSYFYKNSLHSDFTIDGGGLTAGLSLEKRFKDGELLLRGSWKQSQNKRSAATDLRPWQAELQDGSVSSKPWGLLVNSTSGRKPASYEGSLGSLETAQESLLLNAQFKSRSLRSGEITHKVSSGIDYERASGTLDRAQATSQYYLAKLDEAGLIDCATSNTYCIDGEQYFDKRLYFAADKASATINLLDAYLEDLLTWKRLELRPGVRVSHDDFMNNTHIAPRFSASLDLFGNGRTILIGGANRYYGRTLLANKLREGSQPSQIQDLKLDPASGEYVWQDKYLVLPPSTSLPDGSIIDYRAAAYQFSRLKTPYADEFVLAVKQELAGGILHLAWVKRRGQDEFSTQAIDVPAVLEDYRNGQQLDYLDSVNQLTNNGSSKHQEYSLEWERNWEKQYFSINATYQESTTSNEKYSGTFDEADLVERVWYDGSYLHRSQLPRQEFNQPWIANLTYSIKLPYNIRLTNITRYKSGYEGLGKLSAAEKTAQGIVADSAYRREDKAESWVFDWQIDWKLPVRGSKVVELTVDIYNVFDQKAEVGDPTGPLAYSTYELGRQFWVGMAYKF